MPDAISIVIPAYNEGQSVTDTLSELETMLTKHGIEAEIIIVERDIRLVELTGSRLHLSHLSTGTATDAVRAAKARGLAITCDTAPPYFALNEHAVDEARDFLPEERVDLR